jgi:hypothetical protein
MYAPVFAIGESVMLTGFGWWGVVSVFREQGPDDIVLHPFSCL